MTAHWLSFVRVSVVAIALLAASGACGSNTGDSNVDRELSNGDLEIAPALVDQADAPESADVAPSRPLIDEGRARRIADQSIRTDTPVFARDAIVFETQFLVSSEELLEMARRSDITHPPESATDTRFWVLAYHGNWPLAFGPGGIEVPFGGVNFGVSVVGADSGLVIGTRTGLADPISKLKTLRIGDATVIIPALPQPLGPESRALSVAWLEIVRKFPEVDADGLRIEAGPKISRERLLGLSADIDLDTLDSDDYPIDADFIVVNLVSESPLGEQLAPHYYAIVDLESQVVVASGISGDQPLSVN